MHFLVQAICLPAPNQDFSGQEVIAMGWGRFLPKALSTTLHGQSKILKYVHLNVSYTNFFHKKMFGTVIAEDGPIADVCSGDSGVFLPITMQSYHHVDRKYIKDFSTYHKIFQVVPWYIMTRARMRIT